jgi:hypothetical protein
LVKVSYYMTLEKTLTRQHTEEYSV